MVPFLFVLSPTLLLLGDDHFRTTVNVATAVVGVYLISVAAIGYFSRPLGLPFRVLLILAGLAALLPDFELGFGGIGDMAGVVIGVLLLGREYLLGRRRPETAPVT